MSSQRIFDILIEVAVLLFAVSFHESAHGFVAMKCGDNTAKDRGRISLNPLRHIDPIGSLFFPLMLAISGLPVFGWARPVPVSLANTRNPRQANLLISAAGPVSNLLLAVAFTLVVVAARLLAWVPGAAPVFHFAALSVLVNVSLATFNLLPIPPLDGFGVLESLSPPSFYPALAWLRRFGFIVVAIAVFTGILNPVFRFVQVPVLRWLQGGGS